MNAQQLGKALKTMYSSAANGEKVAMIHLFGITYSNEISASNVSDIIDEAGISRTYKTEVSKGVKLAKYVQPKIDHRKISK